MNSNVYTNIEAHILRSKMNSIHERHFPTQEKPKSMNHTFSKLKIWRNNRKNKINSISCHHISLITIFPTSQEFFNSDSVWESYDNFSEDAQNFLLHKVSHFSPRVVKYQRDTWLMNKWNVWSFIDIGCGGFIRMSGWLVVVLNKN